MYTIRVSNSLYPDQTGHFVGPDLGPNCLQGLSEAVKEIKAVFLEKEPLDFCLPNVAIYQSNLLL